MMRGSVDRRVLLVCLAGAVCIALCIGGCAVMRVQPKPEADRELVSIRDIEVRPGDGDETIVSIATNAPAQYTAFRLVDPPRVILDISAERGKDIAGMSRLDGPHVETVMLEEGVGEGPASRITIGLRDGVDYSVEPEENAVVVRLVGPDASVPEATPEAVAPQSDEPQHPDAEAKAAAEPRIFFTPKPAPLNQILGVDFAMLDRGASRLSVTTDKKVPYTLSREGDHTLALALTKTTIPPLLKRRIDSSYFEGVVDRVTATVSPSGDSVVLGILLRETVPFHVKHTDTGIHIDFSPTSVKPREKKLVPKQVIPPEPAPAPASPIVSMPDTVAPEPVQPAPAREITVPAPPGGGEEGTKVTYTGTPMTMEFVNAEVTNILRLIGEVSNLNIIWGPEVQGSVSMRLKKVPWDQALDLVLKNSDLGQRRDGNVIWITTRSKLTELEEVQEKKRVEREQRLEAERKRKMEEQKRAEEQEPLVTEYIPLDFAQADKVKDQLEQIKTERGTVSFYESGNTVIIKDTADSINLAKKIIREQFDRPEKQIMIEARIVDASTNFSRDLGVQWASLERDDEGNSVNPGFSRVWRSSNSIDWESDATGIATSGELLSGGSFSTNAPEGWTPNIGLSFAMLTNGGLGTISLDASLALAETEGTATVISAPKVIASNGEEAVISRGDIIYKEIRTAEEIDVKELEATLSLTVTPTVSFNNFVTMQVEVTDDKARTDLSGKTEKSIKTKLIVKSGETIVIGGIYKESKEQTENGVPILRDIPGLGWLFKTQTKASEKTELLIFLTPRVIESGEKRQ